MNRIELAQDAQRLTRDLFVERYPNPVLMGVETVEGNLESADPFARTKTLQHSPFSQHLPLQSSRVYELPRTQFGRDVSATLGRATSCDLVIVDYTISREHARFWPAKTKIPAYIQDLASRNGTWVSDQRLAAQQTVPLESGMKLRLGRIILRYFLPSDLYDHLGGAG